MKREVGADEDEDEDDEDEKGKERKREMGRKRERNKESHRHTDTQTDALSKWRNTLKPLKKHGAKYCKKNLSFSLSLSIF